MSSDVTVIVRSIGHPLLPRALQSLAAQTYQPEITVVVARPGAVLPAVDGTARYLRSDTPLSRPKAANVGLQSVTTPFFMFLDEDDCFEPGHVAGLRDALLAHPDYAIAFSRMRVWEAGQPVDTSGRGFWRQRLWEALPFWLHTALCRTTLRDAGVAFDNTLAICEDWDFWIQCAALTDCWFVDQLSANYFRDTGSSGTGGASNVDADRITSGRMAMEAKWSTQLAEIRAAADTALRAAQYWTRLGDIAKARAALQVGVGIDRGNPQLLNWLAACALRQDDAASAFTFATRALQTDPAGVVLWLQLARAAYRLNRTSDRDHAIMQARARAQSDQERRAIDSAEAAWQSGAGAT